MKEAKGAPTESIVVVVDASLWELAGMGKEPTWRLVKRECHRVGDVLSTKK